jgi:N-acetylmuramoyl-L-alanine amidase
MDRRRFLGALGTLAALSASPGWATVRRGGARVTGCRLESAADGARLVLDLSGAVPYRVFALSSPARVVVDLGQVDARLPAPAMGATASPVAGIRHGPHEDGVRVVLDMRDAVQPRASLQRDAATGAYRLVVRLPSALAQVRHVRRPAIVAIDAGHGGKDPGAVSASHAFEKHVALAIATRLHGLLAADARFQPALIRDDDRFVPLHERVLIAHRRKADLFVSIHADAAPTPTARGASVWVLSQHGASSAMARWLAESENASDRYAPLRDSALYTRDPALSKVLVDMSMDATIASSLDLGRLMIDDLQQVTRIHQQRVDQAGFAVLKSPDIPSILVETGFMSNADDCRRLVTATHQQELAEALKSGIAGYFRQYPVQGPPA